MWDEENNNENILKACPFCGSPPRISKGYDDETEYYIECSKCEVNMYRDYHNGDDFKKQAIKAWNRRI